MKDKAPLLPTEEVPRAKQVRRKDTKKWCRGKEGVLHQPEYRLNPHLQALNERTGTPPCQPPQEGGPNWCDHEVACSACGKVLEPFVRREACPGPGVEGVPA